MLSKSLAGAVEHSVLRCHGFQQGRSGDHLEPPPISLGLTRHRELCRSCLQLRGFDNHGALCPKILPTLPQEIFVQEWGCILGAAVCFQVFAWEMGVTGRHCSCAGASMHLGYLSAVSLVPILPRAVFVFSRSAGYVATLSRGSIDQLITPKTFLLTRKS